MRRTPGKHLLIELSTYPVELVKCQWGDNNSRRNGIQTGTSFTPSHCLRHDALHVATFRQLVGMERIADVRGLQYLQTQQFFRRCASQLRVYLDTKGRQAMSGLTGYRNARSTLPDNFPNFFQQYRRTVQVDFQNGLDRGLRRRHSCRIDQHGYLSILLCRIHQSENRGAR